MVDWIIEQGGDEYEEELEGCCDLAFFLDEVPYIIAEDDAFIMMSSGHESLNSVNAYAEIVTAQGSKHLDLAGLVTGHARQMLDDPLWHTKLYY